MAGFEEMDGLSSDEAARAILLLFTEEDIERITARPTFGRYAETTTKKAMKKMETPETNWALIDRVLALDSVRTVYLDGPPGLGKTYVAQNYGRTGNGVFSVTMTEETPAAELRGYKEPVGGEFVWEDGTMIAAMRAGGRLVINEITHAGQDALSFLMPILESFDTARLTLPNREKETIVPAPGFHVICTDNCPPSDLPAALRDRFDAKFHISSPHPEAINGLPEDLRDVASRLVVLEGDRAVSLRGWFAYAKMRGELGDADAAFAVFGPERCSHIIDAITVGSAEVAVI